MSSRLDTTPDNPSTRVIVVMPIAKVSKYKRASKREKATLSEWIRQACDEKMNRTTGGSK